MTYLNRWGLATGLAALVALAGQAHAQAGTATGREDGEPAEASPGDERTTLGSTPGEQDATQGTGTSGAGGQAQVSKELQERLQKIHAANQAEVQMGQLGEQSAQDPQVRQFAQMMAEDHQQSDRRLQQMTQGMGITLTGEEYQEKQKDARKAMQKVQGKSGNEFDKAYMSQMVKEHESVSKDLDKAAKEARKQNQPELASFLEQTHQGVQGHLQQAKQIEKSVKAAGRTAEPGTTSPAGSGRGSSAEEGGMQEEGGQHGGY